MQTLFKLPAQNSLQTPAHLTQLPSWGLLMRTKEVRSPLGSVKQNVRGESRAVHLPNLEVTDPQCQEPSKTSATAPSLLPLPPRLEGPSGTIKGRA